LKAFGTLTEVGVYSLGTKVGMIMSVLVNAFVVAWLPVMFRISREAEAKVIYSRVLTYYLLVTGALLLAVTSYRHEVVGLIARPEYADATGVVLLVLAAYMLQGVYYVATVGVVLTDRTQWVSLVAGIAAVLSLGLNLALIPPFGMYGAAWAMLLSFVFLAVFMRVIAERHYSIPLEGRRIVTLLVAGAVVLIVNTGLIGHETPAMAVFKLVPLALFPVLLWVGRFFSTDELVRGQAIIRRALSRNTSRLP
jgi:O-antigen/teichoic acid export membrane protein